MGHAPDEHPCYFGPSWTRAYGSTRRSAQHRRHRVRRVTPAARPASVLQAHDVEAQDAQRSPRPSTAVRPCPCPVRPVPRCRPRRAAVRHTDGLARVYGGLRRRVLAPAGKAAGVPWIGFHTFRHTCASRLLAGRKNIAQVSRWLGHANPAFTLRTYAHLMDEGLGDVEFMAAGSATRGQHRTSGLQQEPNPADDAAMSTHVAPVCAVSRWLVLALILLTGAAAPSAEARLYCGEKFTDVDSPSSKANCFEVEDPAKPISHLEARRARWRPTLRLERLRGAPLVLQDHGPAIERMQARQSAHGAVHGVLHVEFRLPLSARIEAKAAEFFPSVRTVSRTTCRDTR